MEAVGEERAAIESDAIISDVMENVAKKAVVTESDVMEAVATGTVANENKCN